VNDTLDRPLMKTIAWDRDHDRPADLYCPPECTVMVRAVGQPRQMVLGDAPTFQVYVARSDGARNPGTSSYLPLTYLRDEYISTWGTDHGGRWLG